MPFVEAQDDVKIPEKKLLDKLKRARENGLTHMMPLSFLILKIKKEVDILNQEQNIY